MKKVLLILTLAVFAAEAVAQGASRVREDLARPDFASGARVEVRVADDAAAALRSADLGSGRTSATVYVVNLFRDNSQSARENAESVMRQFSAAYPGIPVKISYQSPYFKVEAGRFVDRTDAEALRGRVTAQFQLAVVAPQEVSFEEIIAGERTPAADGIEETLSEP